MGRAAGLTEHRQPMPGMGIDARLFVKNGEIS